MLWYCLWRVPDGKTRFIDPQPGSKDVSWYFSQIKPAETCLIKVDNLKFNAKIYKSRSLMNKDCDISIDNAKRRSATMSERSANTTGGTLLKSTTGVPAATDLRRQLYGILRQPRWTAHGAWSGCGGKNPPLTSPTLHTILHTAISEGIPLHNHLIMRGIIFVKMEPAVGVEPTTCWLQVNCSGQLS